MFECDATRPVAYRTTGEEGPGHRHQV